MGISGPITTVHDKHICCELIAVPRIGLSTSRRLSDRSRSAGVVLGNHPISVMPNRKAHQSYRFSAKIMYSKMNYFVGEFGVMIGDRIDK